MSDRRIIITGASGFIGRYLMQHLEQCGDTVLGISTSQQVDQNYTQLDLLDSAKTADVIRKFSPTHVVHLAAIASVTHSDSSAIYAINVVGTENLLEAIRLHATNIEHVVLTSTAGVYGNHPVDFLKEDIEFNPANHYGISKASMEMLSRQYKQDFKITVVRPFNIIGVGQNKLFLIPKLTKLFADRQSLIEVGNISSVRDYVSVNDCVRVISNLLSSELDFNIVNICSGVGLSGDQIIEILTNITNHHPTIKKTDAFVRRSEVWRLVGDPKRMNTILGSEPIASIDQVLRDMIDDFKITS